jgi:hypothetical protein
MAELTRRTSAKTPVKVVIDEKKLRKFLDTNAAAQVGLLKTALTVESAVKEAAPYGKSLSWPWGNPIKHGWFRDSLHTRPFRGGYRVFSRDPFAHLIEFGSINNPTYAPFRRVIRAFKGRTLPNKASTSATNSQFGSAA